MSFDGTRFSTLVQSWGLRHFEPSEFLARVGSRRGRATNQPPPEHLWRNMQATAIVVDELRERLGVPIVITSAYRSPAYNRAVGGATFSQHKKFKALDIQARGVSPEKVYRTLLHMRDIGLFRGGVGVYNTFVHVDTRGSNATWDERR